MRWLAGTTMILLAAAAPAAAASPSLHVTPTTVAPGALVHVRGNADGCSRGNVVTIISKAFPGHGFAGLGTITARVRIGGGFAATGHIRRNARPGRYIITARCGGGNLGVAAHIRVT